SPDRREMEFRWANTWHAMHEEGYDGLIVAGTGAIGTYGALQFVTGFFPTTRGAFALVRRDAPPVLLLRSEVERRAVIAEGGLHSGISALNATGDDYPSAVGTLARE